MKLFTLSDKITRDDALKTAKKEAVQIALDAGAKEDSIDIVEVEDVPLAYHPGNATRIKVKAAGNLI